jgi:exosortase/archaeosortase family protein
VSAYLALGSDPTQPHDRPIVRVVLAAGLIAFGIAVIVGERSVRHVESQVLGMLASGIFGVATSHASVHPVVFFHTPATGSVVATSHATPGRWMGLEITPECTSAWLVAPLLFLAGLLVLGRRLTVHAVVVATAVTGGVLLAVNMVRLLMILLASHWWGLDGYHWTHEVYGSLVTVFGVCAGLALFVTLVIRLSRRQLAPGPG